MYWRGHGARAAVIAIMGGLAALSVQPPAQAAVPDAPTAVTVTNAESSLVVRWTAPASDGGKTITGYTASAYTESGGSSAAAGCTTESVSATNCTITGLTNGTTYYVGVTATNTDGTGSESTRVEGMAGTVPSAPLNVSVSRIKGGGLAVTWEAPSNNGGTAITSYTATAATSSSSTATAVSSCTTAGLGCDITGLETAVTYYIRVRATNSSGTGASSSAVTASSAGSPTAPQNVTVTRGNGFGLVKWNAPTSTGGSTITRYVAEAFTVATGGDRVASCEPASVSTRQCNIGPLANGGRFYIQVTAYNAVADGVTSTPRVEFIPAAPPTVPRNVTGQRAGGNVEVAWQVPESDGGLPISAYTASAYSAASGGSALGSCTTTGASCQITGLRGAAVYVDVVAKTDAGSSPASSPRVKVRVIDAVDVPLAVAGSARPAGIAVTWLPPLDDGGNLISAYRATAYADPKGGAPVSSCDLAVTSGAEYAGRKDRIGCTIKGLTPDVVYYLEVGATSEAGTTTTPERTAVRVRQGLPLPVRTVSGFPGAGQIAVAWSLPASDGGEPIIEYRVRAFDKEKGDKPESTCTAKGDPKATVFGCILEVSRDFEPYWVEVLAKNSRGWGKATVRAVFEAKPSVPGAPQRVQLNTRSNGMSVSWEQPLFDGGYPVYSYVATAYNAATGGTKLGECTAAVDPKNAETATTPTRCTIPGLSEDSYVYVEVIAENTVGFSAPSTRVSEAVIPGPPVAPTGVTATRQKRGVQVSWTAVASTPVSTVTGYRVRAFASRTSTEPIDSCTASGTTSCILDGADIEAAGYVEVAAQSALGWGDPSVRTEIVSQP